MQDVPENARNVDPIEKSTTSLDSAESYGLRSTVQPIKTPGSKNACSHDCSQLKTPAKELLEEKKETHKSGSACTNTVPSISNLSEVDRNFTLLPSDQFNLCHANLDDGAARSGSKSDSLETPPENHVQNHDRKQFMRVKPTVYTAMNWDSKVLFQYDVEEECDVDQDGHGGHYSLTGLPFEILQHIAKHLDSFSLCNLSLTCHLLRDVCSSLLNEHGIVLLNWQRYKLAEGCGYTWKVASKRWLFSTSFEPIRSWKFTDNHLTMGDHLKVCPYNKDILSHPRPFKVTELPSQPISVENSHNNKALSWLVSHSSPEEQKSDSQLF
ncbi:F-box only protein 30 [Bulinus truncatus]|nr:F-box only protein 30 [Bulinus truncatus]